ncbi:MAG: glycosyltransferase family 39 protein [Kiritimatiellia bacterium]
MNLALPPAVKKPAFMAGAVVFCSSLLVQAVLLADYCLHSPFYSGLICDSKVYYKWASAIIAGDWFGGEVFHQAPLYPYFIALLWLAAGKGYFVIYAAQALLLACSCLLAFLVGKRYFNTGTGLAAGLLCAFYGTVNFYALKILPDIAGVFLHLCLAWLLLRAGRERQWAAAGFVWGLLVIARPHALLLAPMLLAWAAFLRAEGPVAFPKVMTGLRRFAIFILPAAALVGLVALRNFAIEPDLVIISCNGGENFYMGNNPKAEGIYCRMEGISPDIEHQKEDVKAAAESAAGRKLNRARVSTYWRDRGFEFIRGNFPAYLRLEMLKLKRIFSGIEYTNMYFTWFEKPLFTRTLSIPAAGFYLVLPMAAIGAILLAGRWRQLALLHIMILLGIVNMLVFYVDERYRLSMIPFMIILGAGGMFRLYEILRSPATPRVRKLAALAVAAGALAATYHMARTEPARLEVEPQLYYNLGEVYFEKGEYRRALETFYHSSRLAANNWESAVGVSKTLFAMGRPDVAAGLYRQAFPCLDRELQESFLRDRDLDGLRAYIASQDKQN